MYVLSTGLLLWASGLLAACTLPDMRKTEKSPDKNQTMTTDTGMVSTDTATFGAGCFWCTEAQFLLLEGVQSVISGYSGGHTENPTYEQVCSGNTGHAEVTQITFNPSIISYDELLEAFWASHDPTQLNRQGNDIGTQYRSVIFYHNETQRATAAAYKQRLNEEHIYDKTVVTAIQPFHQFWKAEAYHQDYYNRNPQQSYCALVVQPKVEKFRKIFKDRLRK